MSVKIECDHTGEKYLSEVMNEVSLMRGKINLIAAPCGSGKTTYLLDNLSKQGKMLLLIDTRNNKEMLLHNGEKRIKKKFIGFKDDEEACRELEQKYIEYKEAHPDEDECEIMRNCGIGSTNIPKVADYVDEEYYKIDNVTVMTYSFFGKILLYKDEGKLYSDEFSPDNYDIVACDEIHNMINFKSYGDKGGAYVRCRLELINIIKSGKLTVGISATPGAFVHHFDNSLINLINFMKRPDIRRYHTLEEMGFRSINRLIKNLPLGMKILIYTDRISSMKKIKDEIDKELWYEYTNIASIFSINNEGNAMDEVSLKVRDSIISDGIIPENIDIVIMNAACETGLNIYSHIDIIIVHSCSKETKIQVRGRYRDDLWRLYYRKKDSVDIEVPEKYLNKKLDSELKKELVAEIDEKDFHNRKMGWTTLRKSLIDSGNYVVTDKKSGSKRYSIITPSQL